MDKKPIINRVIATGVSRVVAQRFLTELKPEEAAALESATDKTFYGLVQQTRIAVAKRRAGDAIKGPSPKVT
jgi:hypothetical protein